MRKLFILLAAGATFMVSCNNSTGSKQTAETKATEAPKPAESKLSAEGTSKLMGVVADYYTLKNAFVATNPAQADDAATKLNSSVDALSAYLKTDSTHSNTIQPYLDTMKLNSKILTDIKQDDHCDKKRAPFEKISDAMFAALKAADLKNAHVYRQFCPMAFNDKGAYWLSDEEEIKNPYFGKKMMECGEVRDSLK